MRSLKAIDEDLRQVRTRLLDSMHGSDQWETAWLYIDRLLEERLARVQYLGKHAKSE